MCLATEGDNAVAAGAALHVDRRPVVEHGRDATRPALQGSVLVAPPRPGYVPVTLRHPDGLVPDEVLHRDRPRGHLRQRRAVTAVVDEPGRATHGGRAAAASRAEAALALPPEPPPASPGLADLVVRGAGATRQLAHQRQLHGRSRGSLLLDLELA